jgi:PAS domain S-box-containing protein
MFIREDYFKNIFNTVREAILILDENMKVLSANRSFFTTFKVDAANTIGSLLYDLGNGQWNIPHLRVLLEDVLPKNDTVDDYEIEHTFESIGQKTMLLNACKIREKKNDLPIILLAIEDITERKRLEDLLTESEKRYRRVFETASDSIVLLEKCNGTIIQANPATEIMLGYPEKECIGKNLQDIGVSLNMSDFATIIQDLNKIGILNYDDVPIKTKSGQYIDADIYMVDRANLAQCNIRDVSERKRTEANILKLNEDMAARNQELELANKEMESFVYSIAHDLRAPLRSVSEFAKIVTEDYAEKLEEQGKNYLGRVRRGAEKMNELVEGLLRLSHISRQKLERTQFEMSKAALDVVLELREAGAGRSVEVDIQEGLIAFADPMLLNIVLSNLIGNAWKFTSKTENARMEFGSFEKSGKTTYYLRDNGAGFNAEYMEKMFMPFHRLHTDQEFEGTGVGLAIVERIIHRHGGRIWAEGKVGQGATIFFTLT